jgi:D-glycero-D-manno-heptose 1,7-bisphosphate phosphatase
MHPTSRSPYAPLPGTDRAPRALFVDRWGTLLERPDRGHCSRFSQVRFHTGALEALYSAHRAGWKLYLIGNEDTVAFGRLAESSWRRLQDELMTALASQGVLIERCYACLDHPEGKDPHAQDSVFRLPNTGTFYHAANQDGVELGRSWVIGDSTAELVAGWRAGMNLAGVRTGEGCEDGNFHVEPDMVGDHLADVLGALLERERAALR